MAIEYAHIKPNNIRLARERANLSITMLAQKLGVGVTEDKLADWESGEKKVTFRQAQNIANKTLVPFGYLFLEQIHEDKLPIPDLRTLESQAPQQPSAELLSIIQIIQEQQDWYRDYLKSQNADRNEYIGNFNVSSSVNDIVNNMRTILKVSEYPVRGTWEEYLRLLIERIENAGILVMRRGDLGHSTKPLTVEEFRGFAIYDEFAPVIFINQSDVPSARLFTLIHELAHIWIGESAISDGSPITEHKEEVLCNAVSAEFLVPSDEFLELWDAKDNWENRLPDLRAHFHVSDWVLARKALSLGLISYSNYDRYITKLKREYIARKKSSSGGPTYYKTRKSQLSNNFARALTSEAMSGRILLRDAGRLLWMMKPHNIRKFAKELGI